MQSENSSPWPTWRSSRQQNEIQAGVAGIVLPEAEQGTYSAQPELRLGFFIAEGLQLQLEANGRVWPLGDVASKSLGTAGHLVWFPKLGPQNRNLYLMGGAGMVRTNPPLRLHSEVSYDPLLRGGMGYKIPLQDLGIGFLTAAHLTAEYRFEYLMQDEDDLVSGGVLAVSYFL